MRAIMTFHNLHKRSSGRDEAAAVVSGAAAANRSWFAGISCLSTWAGGNHYFSSSGWCLIQACPLIRLIQRLVKRSLATENVCSPKCASSLFTGQQHMPSCYFKHNSLASVYCAAPTSAFKLGSRVFKFEHTLVPSSRSSVKIQFRNKRPAGAKSRPKQKS